MLGWEKNGIVPKDNSEKAAEQPHRKTITICDFEGLSPEVQKRVLGNMGRSRLDSPFGFSSIVKNLEDAELGKQLETHHMRQSSRHAHVLFGYHGGKATAAFQGEIVWDTAEGESYLVRIQPKAEYDILLNEEDRKAFPDLYMTGFAPLDVSSEFRAERYPRKNRQELADEKRAAEFIAIYNKTCEALAEEGKKEIEWQISDESLLWYIRTLRPVYLEDGSGLPATWDGKPWHEWPETRK